MYVPEEYNNIASEIYQRILEKQSEETADIYD